MSIELAKAALRRVVKHHNGDTNIAKNFIRSFGYTTLGHMPQDTLREVAYQANEYMLKNSSDPTLPAVISEEEEFTMEDDGGFL